MDKETRRAQIEAIFEEVVRAPISEQQGLLDMRCGADLQLRDAVRRLIDADSETVGDLRAALAGDIAHIDDATRHWPRIGSYQTMSVLGVGGFGVVYEARQSEPIRRTVAIKLIKPGMDSDSILARFEAERQALALMDHPSIVKIFDAGATDRGHPYFVMELVRGIPITRHCDQNKLSIEDRLLLFQSVCDAVQHAHTKGVLHRDLKPTNVLVEYKSGVAVPKLIDFGVAKALNQQLTERTIFTERGQLIGTPEYMSPEQAEMSAQDIDAQSDVYSLGVLLYELLTGRLPFDPESLRAAGFAEIQRIIREVDPPKPSTKFETLLSSEDTVETAIKLARERSVSAHELPRRVRGDLDWVVMRCLEKDRRRRYETANELRREIDRFLRCEPVSAGPPSNVYRVRKFVGRNRAGVAASAAVLLALFLGIVATSWQAIVATRAQARAEARLETGEQLVDRLLDDVLRSVSRLRGATGPQQDLIESIVQYLDAMSVDPVAARSLMSRRSAAYLSLGGVLGASFGANVGDTAGAIQALEEAISAANAAYKSDPGPELALAAITCRRALAGVLRNARQAQRADEIDEEAIRELRAIVARHPDIDGAKLSLAAALRGAASAGQEQDLARSLRYCDEAISICESLLDAKRSADLASRSLALTLRQRGYLAGVQADRDTERASYEQSYEILQAVADANPDDAIAAMESALARYYLADSYLAAGVYDEALALLDEALVLVEELYSSDAEVRMARALITNVDSLASLSLILKRRAEVLYWNFDDAERALPALREYARICAEIANADPASIEKLAIEGEALMRLGEMLGRTGETDESVSTTERARKLLAQAVASDAGRFDWQYLLAWANTILCLEHRNAGRLQQSRAHGRQAVQLYERAGVGSDIYERLDYVESLVELSTTQGMLGETDIALQQIESALAMIPESEFAEAGDDLIASRQSLLELVDERRMTVLSMTAGSTEKAVR